ncbi:MAG: hypothetical protein RL196_237 [Actinomycetota bacterium]|jgi:hypothetical protein
MSYNKSIVSASLASAVAIAILLSGCSAKPSNSSSDGPSTSESASPTPTIEYETAPLTGVAYVKGTNQFLVGPAVMGKVDNSEAARPQNALNQADIVFEEMVEGGMTRFLAVWHSQLPTKFGPVRSVRPMDPDLGAPFGGIISFSGGQKPFVVAMQKTDVFVTNETNQLGKGTFERVTDREAPHNVMVRAQKLASQHKSIKAPGQQFSFATEAAAATASLQGKATVDFSVSFPAGKPTWKWNGASGTWLRSQYGTKEKDASDGKQLHAANVVVLKTKIDTSYKDFKYGYVPRTVVIGGGSGVVFTNGKAIAVKFKKANQNDPIHLVDNAGNPVSLAPGNTWVELMPRDSGSLKVNYAKVVATATPTPTK